MVKYLHFVEVFPLWRSASTFEGANPLLKSGFLRQVEHFLTDMSNRVEHQKLNQVAAELPPG